MEWEGVEIGKRYLGQRAISREHAVPQRGDRGGESTDGSLGVVAKPQGDQVQ